MRKPDRFKLESAIMRMDMSEDIGLLMKQYLDGPKMTEDELANHMMGLEYMTRLRWMHLWEVFCQEFNLDGRVGLDGTVLRQRLDDQEFSCPCKLKENVA